MSHEPPVPPDNQSPFPIAEAPHSPPAPLPPVAEKSGGTSRLMIIGGAIAAIGLAAGGVAAFALGRGKPKTGSRRKPQKSSTKRP